MAVLLMESASAQWPSSGPIPGAQGHAKGPANQIYLSLLQDAWGAISCESLHTAYDPNVLKIMPIVCQGPEEEGFWRRGSEVVLQGRIGLPWLGWDRDISTQPCLHLDREGDSR